MALAKRAKNKLNPGEQLYVNGCSITSKCFIDILCSREMFNVIVPQLDRADKEKRIEIEKLIKKIEQNKTKTYEEIKKIIRSIKELNSANKSFRRSQIVLLVSLFDRFIYSMLEAIYTKSPEKILKCEKQISYQELFKFRSKKEIISGTIRKEITSMMKEKSRLEQLKIIEKKEKLNFLNNNKELINIFLEITERRNLFAHYNNEINEEYIKNCKRIDNNLYKNLKIGKELNVDEKYFNESCDTIMELIIKLSFSILKYEFSKDEKIKKSIDGFFNEDIGYELMKDKKWKIAEKLFKFFLSFNKQPTSSDEDRMIFLINYCICLKKQGKISELTKIIDDVEKYDFKMIGSIYRLACYILKEKYDDAVVFMTKMRKRDLNKNELLTWVIFEDFRLTPQFKIIFKKLFKENYKPLTSNNIIKNDKNIKIL